MTLPNRLEVTFPVTQAPVLTHRGIRGQNVDFIPTEMKAWANLYPDGKVLVDLRALDPVEGWNASVWRSFDDPGDTLPTVPGWCPSLPAWFRDTVAAMGYAGALPVPRDTDPQGENPE